MLSWYSDRNNSYRIRVPIEIIVTYLYIHTYHSRFIPEGVAEASQIFLGDVLPKLFSYE
jgi:hypothetical protein